LDAGAKAVPEAKQSPQQSWGERLRVATHFQHVVTLKCLGAEKQKSGESSQGFKGPNEHMAAAAALRLAWSGQWHIKWSGQRLGRGVGTNNMYGEGEGGEHHITCGTGARFLRLVCSRAAHAAGRHMQQGGTCRS